MPLSFARQAGFVCTVPAQNSKSLHAYNLGTKIRCPSNVYPPFEYTQKFKEVPLDLERK